MLTESQFYLRILEEILMSHGEPHCASLKESDDLRQYLEEVLGLTNIDEDDPLGHKEDEVMGQIERTLHGFVQSLGKRVGIDLKFSTDGY